MEKTLPEKKKARILFMGTGDIALPSFRSLLDSEYELIGLITQPDKPVGRKQLLTPPQIKTLALEKNITVWQPEKARNKSFIDTIEALAPDIIVVMAYGQLLPPRLLSAPKVAIINIHASLLPLYRGASCIQAPLAEGQKKTGITIMHVVKQLDAGDIILQEETPLSADDTGLSVHDRLAEMSPPLLLRALPLLLQGTAPRTPQNDAESSYAPKLLRNDGLLDFSLPSEALERLIRAYHPWPGTFTTYIDKKGKERRLKIFPPCTLSEEPESPFSCKCGDAQFLNFTQVQPEGSKVMSLPDFLKGAAFQKAL